MQLIFIYGPPGVGKLTVAKGLARLTGFKLWDNHRSIDAVLPVFGYGHPALWPLVSRLMLTVLREAANHDVDTVFTNVFAADDDASFVEDVVSAVSDCGSEVCFVQLACSTEEHERRIVSPTRENKMNTVAALRRDIAEHNLTSRVPSHESLHIDNTDLAPADAALRIAQYYGLPISAD